MTPFTLQDVLERSGIAPAEVNVMLHSPRQPGLLRMLPGLVRTRRSALEAYQAVHGRGAEGALTRGRPWVASFVKTGPGARRGRSAMLFAGLYRNEGSRMRPRTEIAADPEVVWLKRTFGAYEDFAVADQGEHRWFDLQLSEEMRDLQGRLVIEVALTPNYIRLAENLDAPILAIHERSTFDAAPPDWSEMILTAGLLDALPEPWAARLREWRGIYLITDESDGARYVGSAYGEENILGRWRAHVAGDAGVTAGLAARNPATFRFSILELLSPTAEPRDVIAIEQTWMDRLHTRAFGLNFGGREA